MQEILYGVGLARDAAIAVEVLAPAQVKDLWPAAVVDDLVGAVLFPTDGTVNPGDAALSFAKGAVDAGTRYLPDTEVTGFVLDGGRVSGVQTSRGQIEAETVLGAAERGSPSVKRSSTRSQCAQRSGVRIDQVMAVKRRTASLGNRVVMVVWAPSRSSRSAMYMPIFARPPVRSARRPVRSVRWSRLVWLSSAHSGHSQW